MVRYDGCEGVVGGVSMREVSKACLALGGVGVWVMGLLGGSMIRKPGKGLGGSGPALGG